jgi:hypothetical protein
MENSSKARNYYLSINNLLFFFRACLTCIKNKQNCHHDHWVNNRSAITMKTFKEVAPQMIAQYELLSQIINEIDITNYQQLLNFYSYLPSQDSDRQIVYPIGIFGVRFRNQLKKVSLEQFKKMLENDKNDVAKILSTLNYYNEISNVINGIISKFESNPRLCRELDSVTVCVCKIAGCCVLNSNDTICKFCDQVFSFVGKLEDHNIDPSYIESIVEKIQEIEEKYDNDIELAKTCIVTIGTSNGGKSFGKLEKDAETNTYKANITHTIEPVFIVPNANIKTAELELINAIGQDKFSQLVALLD